MSAVSLSMLSADSTSTKSAGLSVIEIILALGIFAIFAATGVTTILGGMKSNLLADHRLKADTYAKSGLDAALSIRNRGWSYLTPGTFGLSASPGYWVTSSSSDSDGIFTRSLTITSVNRSGGDIVASGGTYDPDTLKATVDVTWSDTGRPQSTSVSTYLTNWRRTAPSDWPSPSQQSSIDLSGNIDGNDVDASGYYAYLVRNDVVDNFVVIDLTNPSSPVVVATLTLPGIPMRITVPISASGNYAYIASAANASELQVVDVSIPTTPSLVGTYDAPGNVDAVAVAVSSSTAYLTRVNSSNHELSLINVSSPTAPSLLGSLNLVGDAMRVSVLGNYAYVASTDNASELQVVNVSSPTAPTLLTSLDLVYYFL